ncbi:MAG: vWA domain-containing protein, partial [Bacteroidota bacterium]
VKVRLQNTTNPLNPTALPPIATCPQDAGHGISGFGRLNVANLVAGFQAEVIPSSDFLFFTDIPEGPATSRPIVFSVKARQPVDLEVVSGAGGNFSLPFSKVSLGVADDGSPRTARVWVTYTPGLAGSSATTTIRVRWTQTMQEWDIAVAANTTDPVKTGVLLVLDQSGSMERTSGLGPGVTRADVLRYSIPPFINLMEAHHGIGIVAFDHNPYEELGITPATPSGKASANAVLGAYEPNDGGFTSIGEAVAKGQDMLSSETLYDNRVMVVFTDGQENHGRYSRRYIADVEHLIDDHVFAVGLGTASQIRPSALRALCNDHNGYLLLTDTISADSQFRLAKYFHQILAGIENKDIILDPDGRLYEGLAQEIPFLVSGTTYQIEVVLLSPGPRLISMTLETPSGKTINVEVSDSHPAVQFEANGIMQFYRINLPILTEDEVIRQGWWKVHLSLRPKHVSLISAYHPGLLSAARAEAQAAAQPAMRSVPFSLNVYSRSTLKLQAALDQSSFEAGGSAYITVNLEEVGIPLEARAFVRAEITYPRGQQEEIRLEEVIPGRFEAAVDLRQDGVYSFRILSQGQTLGGDPFQREKVLTAQVWRNGNQPAPRSPRPSEQQSSAWSQWLDCLLKQKSFWHWLETQGLDVEELRACMKKSKVKSASGTPPADDASQDWKSMLKELLCHPDLIAYLDEDDG